MHQPTVVSVERWSYRLVVFKTGLTVLCIYAHPHTHAHRLHFHSAEMYVYMYTYSMYKVGILRHSYIIYTKTTHTVHMYMQMYSMYATVCAHVGTNIHGLFHIL